MTAGPGWPFQPYYFGLYHWRERGRRLLFGGAAALCGAALARSDRRSWPRALTGSIAVIWGVLTAGQAVTSLLSPPPWVLGRDKYEALAAELPLSDAVRLLDVGCGTGRSLVGLAPAVPEGCSVAALDTFDDRIILGNGGRLAERNARLADLDAGALCGDAARLPIADGSIDVVTMCRVLHDLPAEAAPRALEEARRVCTPEGRVGVLALPYPHGDDAEPATYWRTMVADAGFDIERVVEREDGYTIVVGRAAAQHDGRAPPDTENGAA